MVYLIEFEVGYEGLSYDEFINNWLIEAEFAMQAVKAGKVTYLCKVNGENRVYLVLDGEGEDIEGLLMTLPVMKTMSDKVKLTIKTLINYEEFAAIANKTRGLKIPYEFLYTSAREDGLVYWLEFNADFPGQTLDQFLHTFTEDAKELVQLRKQGKLVHGWKCVGERKFVFVVCVDKPGEIDEFCHNLKFMKSKGNKVKLLTKSIRTYDKFHADLKKWVGK